MAEILIVEDETAINELIKRNLQLVGHRCGQAFDGKEAVEKLGQKKYDLILLDIMLPKLDGYQVFDHVGKTPAVFLTAKGGLADKLKGLTLGGYDYITKPFEMLELLARVENVLRRSGSTDTYFEMNDVQIDFARHMILRNGETVECTPREYALLETLVKNRNIALSRERLLELVWGYDYEGDTRTVDVHIQRLRRKLGWEERICTVYKLGYRLEAPL